MALQTTRFILAGFLLHSLVVSVTAANYNLVKEYSGPTFFDDWTFYDHFDNLTNGDTIFVSASVAASAKLAFVDTATNHAIIKVDNTSNVPFNEKRNTVRITTNDRYAVGSVWVADMLHVPFGCSVWPAWWSQAPTWPAGGEIDTLEGVNMVTRNQMGLHTLPGCAITGATQLSSSTVGSNDCSHLSNNNQGCIVTDGRTESYGQGFANAGGGVWVTEYAESGISIWFFPRANVPSSLSGSNINTIDTSTLGMPTANWPSTNCNMNTFFSAQNLIFDITLCGDFAKPPNIFSQTCTGVCYNDYVIGNGSNYATAYFEIASVKVFGTSGGSTVVNGNGTTSSGGASATGGTGGGTNTTGGSTSGLVGMVDIVVGKGLWSGLVIITAAIFLGL